MNRTSQKKQEFRPARESSNIVLPLVIALSSLATCWHFLNISYDDVFISFRYADNLAAGNGLVFNLGERVEGYSNFLWTVILAAFSLLGAHQFHDGLFWVAKMLGVACAVGTCLGIYIYGKKQLRLPLLLAAAPAFALAFNGPFALWGIGGLETPFTMLLITLAAFGDLADLHPKPQSKEAKHAPNSVEIKQSWFSLNPTTSLLFWTAAALSRPEPVALFVTAAIARMALHYRAMRYLSIKREFTRMASVLFVLGCFLLWRYAYYGEWLPNTYYAKVANNSRSWHVGGLYLNWGLNVLNAYLLAGLGMLVALMSASKRIVYLGGVVFSSWFIIWKEGGDWMPALRFFIPTLPLLTLIVSEILAASLFTER